MELLNEKMCFEDRSFSAYLNKSYNGDFPLPPDICGNRNSNGYLQPCNRSEKVLTSNHDYITVQGSIRSSSQFDKVSDKFPVLQRNKGETIHHNNKEEFNDFDDIRIYHEIGDSTKLRTNEQSDVKSFDQKEYVSDLQNLLCISIMFSHIQQNELISGLHFYYFACLTLSPRSTKSQPMSC